MRLRVRVHPGARRPGLEGRLADGSLKVSVSEPPEGGKANRAVEALLAEALALPRGRVKVVAGASGRLKQVEVEGTAAEIERRIVEALAGRGRPARPDPGGGADRGHARRGGEG